MSMMHIAALLPLLAPLALIGVGALAMWEPGRDPHRVLRGARIAAVLSLLIAAETAGAAALWGPMQSPVLGIGEVGVSVRLDAVSTAMLALVAFLGAVVLAYSRRYLDGDRRHGEFIGRLAGTIASVMWLVTSLALHRLLLFYSDRPGAVVAARKKFIVARLGDAGLAAAAGLLAYEFGTFDIGLLLTRVSTAIEAGSVAPGVHAAAALLVATAALKSAQFPTHGWLAEVMETPTPVSALLHAGILNGGPFLIVRLAPVVLGSPGALHAMILIGGFTAWFASVVMITQPTVKGTFAYSSAAHMGFMLLLCGLGMYTVAIAHLIAHSCYKAHAFLSSGSAVEVVRASKVPGGGTALRPAAIVAITVATFALVVAVGLLSGVAVLDGPVMPGVAAMLAIGLAHLVAQAFGGRRHAYVALWVVTAATATALSFYVLEIASVHLLHGVVPEGALRDPVTLVLMMLVILAFGLTGFSQLLLPVLGKSPRLAAAYVLVRNGFYANAVFDRAVGALRPIASGPVAKEIS